MKKSLKSLFIKEEGTDQDQPDKELSFPVSESSSTRTQPSSSSGASNQYLEEVIEVYEKGLSNINMPGYDFYDFYLAVKAAGSQNEAVYKMAFQMGKTMDGNITPEKLSADAEYYISKINEVYRTYSEKGGQKLSSLDTELRTEKEHLSAEMSRIENDLAKMKQQITMLEQKLSDSRNLLGKVDSKFKPQQDEIKKRLQANDQAMQISIQKLNSTKEAILKFIK